MNLVEARLPIQNVSIVMVVLLDIWSAAVSKTIVDTEICDNTFDYFVEQVLEARKKITHKRAPFECATESPAANYPNQ